MWRWRVTVVLCLFMLAVLPLGALLSRQSAGATPCSCTVFSSPTGQSNFNNGPGLELGFKFIPSVNGYISGVRFYKQGSMGGTHIGRLWTSGGTSLATATFSGESASGWQEVSFSLPVSVTAGTTYVASVSMQDGNYVATSNYFTSDVVNGLLTAPSSGSSGGNGVFDGSVGTFPTTSFNSSNYWVDVSFFDTSTPQVTAVTPSNGTTGTLPAPTLTATFDQGMDASTFTSSTVTVKDPSNNLQALSYSYDAATKTLSFAPTAGLATNTQFTVTIKGGSGTVAKNAVGVALASDYTWTFTTGSTNDCPCSLENRTAPAGSSTFDDIGSVELGVKVRASTNGYITALRFYKPITSVQTTHTGHIWSSTGSLLATVTFSNETEYGWQEATFTTPFRVTAGQLYILAYSVPDAVYQATAGGLNSDIAGGYLTAYADTSAQNAATGSGNHNGVFDTSAGTYPGTGSTNGSYYWIDAVFATDASPSYPLQVGVVQPAGNAYGVFRDQVITASFNRMLDAATVTNSTFRLFDSNNNQVSGTGAYDADRGLAIFTPASQLTYGQRYTAKLSASVADLNGVTLGSEYSWSFTIGAALSSNPAQGPGGPILVVTSGANTYGTYYAEILRTEGLNYFDVKDISTVTASTLAGYDAVVLAEMSLTQAQADMLSGWVTGGGNLVAMRPDTKLASLLGLTDAGTTRSNQYLLINTASGPGSGLVNETIQFKGTATNFTLSGASALATLYSDSSTSTTNPAVTTRAVGNRGGTAVAFAYDLAKSVVAQRQGNQAWAGQNRDGTAPVRANDMFFGAMTGDIQPDWVDINKIHIPQADEQQRLLANILIDATKDKRPLPRFWYLPGDYKAAVILAGDDHGVNNTAGTEGTMNQWLNASATNCSLLDWQCVRASHYVYTSSPLTDARAVQYYNLGFEIGDHVSNTCANFASYAALGTEYTNDLATWRAKYTSLPNQQTHRYHCYVWSDWDSQSRVDRDNGIRFDLNYVSYPGTWIGARSPLMNGSGMAMRFTDASGALMDVYQGTTNFDDQADSLSAANLNATLDNALDSDGYYGIFGTHYDMSNGFDDTIYTAIKTHSNVPMISSQQALDWLDGHGSSNFSNFGGSNGQFTFTIAPAEGAIGLKAMLPTADAGGTLSSLALNGGAVSYQTQAVKGVQYAVFNAAPGSYTATYSDYSSGAGGSGGSSSPSSSSSGKKRATATSEEAPQTSAPSEAVPSEPRPAPSAPSTSTPRTPAAPSSPKSRVLLGIAIVVGVGGLIYLLIRRHNREVTF